MTTTAPSTTAADHVKKKAGSSPLPAPSINVGPPHALPEINFAVEFDIVLDGTKNTIAAEVAQQIGEVVSAASACSRPTASSAAGPVRNLGHGIQVPVGNAVLGHVFNVLGEPLDTDTIGKPDDYWEIHRRRQLRPARARALMFETAHQGHRPAGALRAGWQDRPVRRRRRGQDRDHPRDDPPGRPGARWCLGVRRRRRAHP